jgi:hypothetical protein
MKVDVSKIGDGENLTLLYSVRTLRRLIMSLHSTYICRPLTGSANTTELIYIEDQAFLAVV